MKYRAIILMKLKKVNNKLSVFFIVLNFEFIQEDKYFKRINSCYRSIELIKITLKQINIIIYTN